MGSDPRVAREAAYHAAALAIGPRVGGVVMDPPPQMFLDLARLAFDAGLAAYLDHDDIRDLVFGAIADFGAVYAATDAVLAVLSGFSQNRSE